MLIAEGGQTVLDAGDGERELAEVIDAEGVELWRECIGRNRRCF